jgi:hypothetical protein
LYRNSATARASGESAFTRNFNSGVMGPVQSITYDAAGNVYYGFR